MPSMLSRLGIRDIRKSFPRSRRELLEKVATSLSESCLKVKNLAAVLSHAGFPYFSWYIPITRSLGRFVA